MTDASMLREMSRAQRFAWLAAIQPGTVRVRCGFTIRTIARAVGVGYGTVWKWEAGRTCPASPEGEAYCRVIAALARHLEIDEEPVKARRRSA